MKKNKKELSNNNNSFKYFATLIFIALFLIGISVGFISYIVFFLSRI